VLIASLAAASIALSPAQPTPSAASPPPASGAEPPASSAHYGSSEHADPAPAAGADEHLLRFSLSPYIWLTSLTGDVGVRGVSTSVDKSFVDILDDSDRVFGLMGAVDLKVDRFVFQFNGAWTTAEMSNHAANSPGGALNANVDVDSMWFEFFAGYRLVEAVLGLEPADGNRFDLDLFVGGRVTALQTDLALSAAADITLPDGSLLPSGASRDWDKSKEWVEPFVGARASFTIVDCWQVLFRGDVGGFGVDDSEFSWQVVAGMGYWWKHDGWDMAMFLGYRALSQDYDTDKFRWDVTTHGPVLGASFSFSF
jgi:opacity protein-like surface antigen